MSKGAFWGLVLGAAIGACSAESPVMPEGQGSQAEKPAVLEAANPSATKNAKPSVKQRTLEEMFRVMDGCFEDAKRFCLAEVAFDPAQIRDQVFNGEILKAFIAKHQAKFETYERAFGKYDRCMAEVKATEFDRPESNLDPGSECWSQPEDLPSSLPEELKDLYNFVKAEAEHAKWLSEHQLSDGYRALWALIGEARDPELSEARQNEIAQEMKKLIRSGLKAEAPNWDGKIPLFSIRHASLLKALGEVGADLKFKDAHQNGILHQEDVTVAMLQAALAAGVGINDKNDEGKTPVFYVKDPEVLKAFVKAGADLKVKDQKGQTAILNCIEEDLSRHFDWTYQLNPDCLRIFQDAGVDPQAKDQEGHTLFSRLVQRGIAQKTYDALIGQGVDPKAFLPHFIETLKAQLNECERAARYNPVSFFYSEACNERYRFYQGDLLTQMIKAGLDVQERDPETGNSYLFYVCTEASAQALIKAGLDVNAKNKKGVTAIHFTHEEPCGGALKAMVQAGAKTDDALLLEHLHSIRGSDMGPDEIYDFSVPCMLLRHDASRYSKEALGELLLIYLSQDFDEGGECEGESMPSLLIRLGADLNVKDDEGKTSLMLAESGLCDLLKAGADPRVKDKDGRNVFFQRSNIVDCFYEGGKPNALAKKFNLKGMVNVRDAGGLTPLMVNDSQAGVEGLLKAGADVKAKDKEGKSVLQHQKDPKILEMLKAAGAK